jgi:hypothetical protein
MAYVYRHIRLDKNQPFYIGISKGTKPYNHRANSNAGRNDIWKRISEKTEWEVEILMTDLTWKQAQDKETEFIKLYGRINNNTGILANMTDGGEGGAGVVITDETRKKLSERSKSRIISKESREKMAAKLRGRKLPGWQKEILRKAALGKDVYWCKKKVDQYDLEGNFIRTFDSVSDITKILGINNITKVLNGKRSHAGGFIFVYHGQQFKNISIEKGKKPFLRKKILNLETGDIYDTIKQASVINNINYDSLKCKLKNKNKKGKFIYLEESQN